MNDYLDMTSANGKLLTAIFAWLGETERNLLSERVKEGLEYAKSKGKKLGRPATARAKTDEVKRLFYKEKKGKREIARKLKIDLASVIRIIKDLEAQDIKKGR